MPTLRFCLRDWRGRERMVLKKKEEASRRNRGHWEGGFWGVNYFS